MSTVLNRTTMELRASVHTPDYDDADWIINPDLSALGSVARIYWKISGDVVSEMTQAEKDTADVANLAALKAARKATIDSNTATLVEANENANGAASITTAYIDDGRTLKASIDSAADLAALAAVADTRT